MLIFTTTLLALGSLLTLMGVVDTRTSDELDSIDNSSASSDSSSLQDNGKAIEGGAVNRDSHDIRGLPPARPLRPLRQPNHAAVVVPQINREHRGHDPNIGDANQGNADEWQSEMERRNEEQDPDCQDEASQEQPGRIDGPPRGEAFGLPRRDGAARQREPMRRGSFSSAEQFGDAGLNNGGPRSEVRRQSFSSLRDLRPQAHVHEVNTTPQLAPVRPFPLVGNQGMRSDQGSLPPDPRGRGSHGSHGKPKLAIANAIAGAEEQQRTPRLEQTPLTSDTSESEGGLKEPAEHVKKPKKPPSHREMRSSPADGPSLPADTHLEIAQRSRKSHGREVSHSSIGKPGVSPGHPLPSESHKHDAHGAPTSTNKDHDRWREAVRKLTATLGLDNKLLRQYGLELKRLENALLVNENLKKLRAGRGLLAPEDRFDRLINMQRMEKEKAATKVRQAESKAKEDKRKLTEAAAAEAAATAATAAASAATAAAPQNETPQMQLPPMGFLVGGQVDRTVWV